MNYQKAIRNLPHVTNYLTSKKVLNYLKYRRDLGKRSIITSSFPPGITFQSSGYCNSNCRLCPVGLGIKGPQKGFLEIEKFRKVIDEANDYLVTVDFADWGEPFLNPSVFGMIRYAEEKRIITHASTNLHQFNNENDLEKLLDCGLSFLIVSLHGVSQETYETYQPDKNFEATVEKIKTLISLKKQLKRKTPVINLAFAITKKNKHEIEKMRYFAKEMEVDSSIYTASLNLRFYQADPAKAIKLVEDWAQDDELEPCHNTKFGKYKINELYAAILKEKQVCFDKLDKHELTTRCFCYDPWESLTVNWNGTVSLCCTDYSKFLMGDTNQESIMTIWNNKRYQAVRQFLAKELVDNAFHFPCEKCIRY